MPAMGRQERRERREAERAARKNDRLLERKDALFNVAAERRKKFMARAGALKQQYRLWTLRYGNQNRFKRAFAPAYNAAVAPVLASAVAHINKPVVRVLVVGGGNGTFSRNLLPGVNRLLARAGIQSRLQVVESDLLSQVVRRAPGNHRIAADLERLPFASHQIDLIVGQTMFHHVNAVRAVQEIGRVLSSNGCFIHVQDNLPNPVGGITQSGKAAQVFTGTQGNHMLQARSLMDAEILIKTALATGASRLHMDAEKATGEKLVPYSEKFPSMGGFETAKLRAIDYMMGMVAPGAAKNVPAGKRLLRYTGLVTWISPVSVELFKAKIAAMRKLEIE